MGSTPTLVNPSFESPLVIPAALYDYHELVTLIHGGIGQHNYTRVTERGDEIPNCIIGQIEFAGLKADTITSIPGSNRAGRRLYSAMENDYVFGDHEKPIKWKTYCKRRNIVRGK